MKKANLARGISPSTRLRVTRPSSSLVVSFLMAVAFMLCITGASTVVKALMTSWSLSHPAETLSSTKEKTPALSKPGKYEALIISGTCLKAVASAPNTPVICTCSVRSVLFRCRILFGELIPKTLPKQASLSGLLVL